MDLKLSYFSQDGRYIWILSQSKLQTYLFLWKEKTTVYVHA